MEQPVFERQVIVSDKCVLTAFLIGMGLWGLIVLGVALVFGDALM